MKDMFRSQREEAEREFELARAEEEEMSEINFKSTFFLGHPVQYWNYNILSWWSVWSFAAQTLEEMVTRNIIP